MAQKKKKSPAKKQNTGEKSYKSFPYELTIGIIVKNDVIRFEKLMESLQPLRDAISCQLIVTDTGSTDGTREVAERYADLLLDFEWIDDFAAARNTGVEKAEGRWFFAVDSDNEMDDTYPVLVDFLQSDISHNVEFVNLTMRHYTQKYGDRSVYHDTQHPILRSHQIQKHYYHDRIHEHIKVSQDMVFHNLLDLVVDHWGYTEDIKQSKTDRNEKIMLQMLEEDPTNIKQHMQLIMDTKNYELKNQRIDTAITIANAHNLPATTHQNLYVLKGRTALDTKNWDRLTAAIDELNNHPAPKPSAIQLEMAGFSFRAAEEQHNPEEMLSTFAEMERLYHSSKNTQDLSTIGSFPYQFISFNEFSKCVMVATNTAISLEQPEKALEILMKNQPFAYQDIHGKHIYLIDSLNYLKTLQDFSPLCEIYKLMLEHAHAPDLKLIQQYLETDTMLTQEERNKALAQFDIEIFDSYTAFCAFRRKDFAPDACTDSIKNALTKDPNFYLNPLFNDLLYGYLCTGADPLHFVEKNDAARLVALIAPLFQKHDRLLDVVQSAYGDPNFTISTLKQEKIWAYLGMNAAHQLASQENPDTTAVESMFFEANHLMYDYATKVYQASILSPEGAGLLPVEEFVSPYIAQAKDAKTGNQEEYTKLLQEIQKISPAYGKILDILINQPYREEFSALAEKVKSTIQTLLASGETAQAKLLLSKYETIAPNDPDLPAMLARCQ